MNRTKSGKHPYESASLSTLDVQISGPILVGSIVGGQKIESSGQEIGHEYDFAGGVEPSSGNPFNFDWESGSN